MPRLENLAVFAEAAKPKNVDPNPGGFRIGRKGKQYVPYHDSIETYRSFTNASLTQQQVDVLVFNFNQSIAKIDPLVFYSLDPEPVQWHLAVEKGKKEALSKVYAELLVELEKVVARENASIADVFALKLLQSTHGPFVIDAFGRAPKIVSLAQVPTEGDAVPQSLEPPVRDNAGDEQLLQQGRNIDVANTPLRAAGLLEQFRAKTVRAELQHC